MKGKRGDEWFPFWMDKWLFGSTRHEFSHAQRAIWVDLLTLSKKDGGFIRANEGVPYPINQLAGMFKAPTKLVEDTIRKAIQTQKLEQVPDGTLFVVSTIKYTISNRHRRRVEKSFEGEFVPAYECFIPCPAKFLSMATEKYLVRRSRLMIAAILDRSLLQSEEVHHIDGNEKNDQPENLMLFATHKDHLQYQNGYEIVPLWKGHPLSETERANFDAVFGPIKREILPDSAAFSDMMADIEDPLSRARVYSPSSSSPKENITLGGCRGEISWTIDQVKDACVLLGIPEQHAQSYYDQYGSQGWKKGNNQPITELRGHMKKRWMGSGWDFDEKANKLGAGRLPVIIGKICSKDGCGLPAVYRSTGGAYDHYYCREHMPEKVKEQYA